METLFSIVGSPGRESPLILLAYAPRSERLLVEHQLRPAIETIWYPSLSFHKVAFICQGCQHLRSSALRIPMHIPRITLYCGVQIVVPSGMNTPLNHIPPFGADRSPEDGTGGFNRVVS